MNLPIRKKIIFNKNRQYYGEDMLKFSVLTLHQQGNGGTNIKIHWSEKNIFVQVDVSAIYQAKISLDLLILASPHRLKKIEDFSESLQQYIFLNSLIWCKKSLWSFESLFFFFVEYLLLIEINQFQPIIFSWAIHLDDVTVWLNKNVGDGNWSS